jgi:Domain of unknown function (DUF4190)
MDGESPLMASQPTRGAPEFADLGETSAQPQDWEARPASERRPKPTGKANRLAVTAFACSMAIPFLLVSGILGAVFGFVALDEIKESEGGERGQGMAQWAIGLGFLNVALSCALIALVIAARAK